jgi:hypothetical protein
MKSVIVLFLLITTIIVAVWFYNNRPAGKFEITLRNVGNETRFDYMVQDAKEIWESIIVRSVGVYSNDDHENLLNIPGMNVEYTGEVRDILIAYYFNEQSSMIISQSGPLVYRTKNGQYNAPITAYMSFDLETISQMTEKEAKRLVIHEMAHALGFGMKLMDKCVVECEYVCEFGLKMFEDEKLTLVAPSCIHWNTTDSDIMSESDDSYTITPITIGAFEDMGYKVNYEAKIDF